MSRSLLKSTVLVSAMTSISRVLGFVRDMVFAQMFGAGSGMDAFVVAFRIPSLLRRVSAEGAFALAFVPVLSEYKQQRPAELRELVDRVCGTLGLLLFALSAIGVLAAPWLILAFAPGFSDDADKYTISVAMLRLTFPYVFFISLVAAAQGILNSFDRFAVPAFTPVLLNICLISAALGLAPYLQHPAMALAWGVLVAGIVQLAFQLPFLARIGLLPRPRWGWRHPGVQRIIKLMIPALLGSSAMQINILVNTVLASYLITGSVSWLYYTDRLIEFPLGVFGVALGTVLLPRLSQLRADNGSAGDSAKNGSDNGPAFSRTLDWGLHCVLLIGLPATVALIVLSGPLLSTFFHYGEFSALDVRMTGRSLTAYAIGLLGFMLVKVLAPGFYARQDSRTPVRISLVAIAVNIALTLLLIGPLAHVGLALATALAAYVNASLLLLLLLRDRVLQLRNNWPILLAKLIAAALFMGTLLWLAAGDLEFWLQAGVWTRVTWLGLLVSGGVLVYGVALWLLGVRPRDFLLLSDSATSS